MSTKWFTDERCDYIVDLLATLSFIFLIANYSFFITNYLGFSWMFKLHYALYVMLPSWILATFIQHCCVNEPFSFKTEKGKREFLAWVFFGYACCPFLCFSVIIVSIVKSKWMDKCKERGYFIPTKSNRKVHVINKLSGKLSDIKNGDQ